MVHCVQLNEPFVQKLTILPLLPRAAQNGGGSCLLSPLPQL